MSIKQLSVFLENRPGKLFELTALLAEKKLVQVLRDFGDYYLVAGDQLRAGDQVIISAKNLYEGKVVG